jgi:hypothetical protein
MSGLSPERLAEIRARLNATSDGPWRAVVSRGTGAVMADALGCYVFLNVRRHPDEYTPDTVERWQRDAVFIANAKQDIPALLAELDAVTAERDEMRQTIAEWRADYGPLVSRHRNEHRDIDALEPDAPYRVIDTDGVTFPLGFHDGDKGGTP